MAKENPPAERESGASLEQLEDLPIIARMVVEIRSDGSRTIARGAMEDLVNGQQVAVEARAESPLELSRALAKLLLSAPLSALLGGSSTIPTADTGLRGRVGALGRRLGDRLVHSLARRDDD